MMDLMASYIIQESERPHGIGRILQAVADREGLAFKVTRGTTALVVRSTGGTNENILAPLASCPAQLASNKHPPERGH